jgi:general secretion pathway protein A
MYEQFFELRERPFELTFDPRFLFVTRGHREALANIEYGISSAKPITVVTGEPGTGKSTLLRAALVAQADRGVKAAYVTNPALTRDELVTLLAIEFDLSPRARASKSTMLDELRRKLIDERERGTAWALVIDEAHTMSAALLDEVRLLANLETDSARLLPLVLAGQLEFRHTLNTPAMLPLRQRIALRCAIGPFDLQETASYIAWRIRVAGGQASRLFTRDAVILIQELSSGIPRTINVICENALITGLALGRRPVTREMLREVAENLDLATSPWVAPAAAQAG